MRLLLLVCALGALACQHAPEVTANRANPVQLTLEPYREGLLSVLVDVAGQPQRFLFDTGAGITVLSPEVARAAGCQPYGRLTGYRMSGERVDMPQCARPKLQAGGETLEPEVAGVFDVMTLLPADWPKLSGVLALSALDGRAITIDLSGAKVVLETPVSLAERIRGANETAIRLGRPVQGTALEVFVKAEAPQGPIWLELDTGNTGSVLVAKHNAPLPKVVVAGMGEVTGKEAELILDGNLGAPFIRQWVLTLDLARAKGWARPAPAQP
jgi:hypothetical protein